VGVEPVERLDWLLNCFEIVENQEQGPNLAALHVIGKILFGVESFLIPAARLE
jgi:hypothetical protein